jgi:predicted helicase
VKQTIKDILEYFREEARNNRDLGDKFERLIAAFLTKDPYYANHFSNVWLWMEWPGRNNMPDTGIDLVAQERATGDFTAIQCKFLDPDHWLQKEDIDSFFTASGKKPFTQRMIICTTDKWGKHAVDACENQQPPVTKLRFQDLEESAIDWSDFKITRPQDIKFKARKKLRPHQSAALADVVSGFKTADRGKLIMACGTGKTFTALKIAEELVPAGGHVLFLVPSISLISQTLGEWCSQSEKPLNAFAVCSDPQAGVKKTDEEDIRTSDLAFPAHTNAHKLVKETSLMRDKLKKNLTVIFSTYQSIAVISEAQKFGLPEFDLVVCDEAHRTTGVEQTELSQKEASCFIAVHDADFLKAKKRLYMTATPRIYDDASKGKAKDLDIQIYSMDDPAIYGAELHRLDFSEAIDKDLLCDYKVLVLAVDKLHVSTVLQQQFAKYGKEFKLDDAVKIVGCWNGLRKRFVKQEGDGHEAIDPSPMRRAVAFSSRIKDSENIRDYFTQIIKDYTGDADAESAGETDPDFLRCEARHVDGKMNSLVRNEALQWLKEDTTRDGTVCRILSNARCLSEGVDVPALDAVMFLNPRKSQVDVVQAVGRVMRKSDETKKQYGYIILPIVVPDGVPPDEALDDNERYKVVWQVLQALRAHDNRFNDIINQIDLNKGRTDKIITDFIGGGGDGERKPGELNAKPAQTFLNFPLKDWEDKIFAKIVIKCGTRKPWEQWAKEVADIANTHIARIKGLLQGADPVYRKKFDAFLAGLRKTLNPSISEDDAIEMLAQHLITKPVFDALFEGYEFTKQNPVSKTMQKMLDLLEGQNLDAETKTLESFYESIRKKARSAQGIDNLAGKQKIIVELYDKFFKTAFPRMAERLGIVYTPVEVVDFIIKSADDALKSEFGIGLTDKNVHILDPFTGTGTFIVRLLQSGIIKDEDLTRKFREELHANEIVLLAYYIAAINIEEAYHGRVKKDYEPFEGIVLTDTFQLSEGKGTFDDPNFQVNSERATKQNKRDIRVIIGNPPYSVGQGNANNNNQNVKYANLDERIEVTYAKHSASSNINSLYDSYIRAVRWASDRVKDKGVICFVSNGGFIDANAMSGLRKCLTDEFAAIYCFNLRGNQRTSGDTSRREGGKIFGSGSRAQIAITLLVKNLERKGKCKLFYHDIGDYKSREEKLNIVTEFGSIKNIPWGKLAPNKSHDWINQRDAAFEHFMPLGLKEDKGIADVEALFVMYSAGVKTNRDTWTYNFSERKISANMKGMVERYNEQVEGFKKASAKGVKVADFINTDPKVIGWSGSLISDVERGKTAKYSPQQIRPSYYRPFITQHLYFDTQFNERPYRTPLMFPTRETENLGICVTGIGAGAVFSTLIVDMIPNNHFQDSGQCFPLYTYSSTEPKPVELSLGDAEKDGRRLNVSDFALKAYRAAYKDAKIGKEDIFYYVYGILHSPEYKTRFAADLTKMLPRIPLAEDFGAFSQAGRKLAEIHLNYETAKPYPVKEQRDLLALDESKLYLVEKMRFGKKDKEVDKTVIQYNSHITLTGIPLEAYDYVVNGKPAIEWIMDRYQFSKEKDSQIVNDPNDWAREHNDPQYILNLLKRIITVSLDTMKIVNKLPALNERKI